MKTCSVCVMNDNSDSTITFDENGQCNYCKEKSAQIGKVYFPNEKGKALLDEKLREIKEYGKDKKYDCIMGISGGLDSSYLLYLGHKWGLRILAIHVDDGFDTEISKENIRKLVAACGAEMITISPDAKQFCALQKAYMRSGVPNLATPQDNVLFSCLYDYMKKENLKYFLTGGNFALECILQRGNTFTVYDIANIRDINKKFGTEGIDKLPLMSCRDFRNIKKGISIQTPRLLNYIDYNRDRAFEELKDFCGFEYYGRKHLENILTAFVQLYWFPKKFGVDKRTSHLSSMIVSGQMTRDEALKLLEEPIYDEKMMAEYIAVIKDKLDISDREFDEIMAAPSHQHEDYKTELYPKVIKQLSKIKHMLIK